LNLLSPRTLLYPGFFSVVVGCEGFVPIAKLPNAPMGEKPALWGAADQGEAGPVIPVLKGAVAVRFKFPKGPEASVPS
jgi:hypothetical protein